MKGKNILIVIGVVVSIVMSGIDQFVFRIPTVIYIPLAVLGIALILLGFLKDKHKR